MYCFTNIYVSYIESQTQKAKLKGKSSFAKRKCWLNLIPEKRVWPARYSPLPQINDRLRRSRTHSQRQKEREKVQGTSSGYRSTTIQSEKGARQVEDINF